MRENRRRAVFTQLSLRIAEGCFAALIGLVVLERSNLGGTRALLTWIGEKPWLAVAAIVTLGCVYSLIRTLIKYPVVGFALYGTLVFAIGTIHYFKLILRHDPLVPYDIFNIKPAFAIVGKLGLSPDRGLFVNALIIVMGCFVLRVLSQRLYRPAPIGVLWRLAVIPCFALCCMIYLLSISRLERLGALDMRYDQYQNYQANGFVISTLVNLSDKRMKEPAGYGEKAIDELRLHIEAADSRQPLGQPGGRPHIIVLQMETYADPRLIEPGIHYETDPFAPLEPFATQIRPFGVLTSILGGGTANTEYEFLTGHSMYFCPVGVIPSVRYIHGPKPSLARDLAEMGYSTMAMHPHTGSFYSRDTVYPWLGFERFVDQTDFCDPEYIGQYISDASFIDKVKEIYEQDRDGAPLFLYAISIQNHGPYDLPDMYRPYPVSWVDGAAPTDMQIAELETFGANIHDSSKALADLLSYFSKVKEPVLVLVFGDHQAAWSWMLELPVSPEQALALYSTVGFVWANYPIDADLWPLISVSGLGPKLLRLAGLDLPLYAKGIDLQYDELKAYNIAIQANNNGSVTYVQDADLEGFRMLQYDRILGKNYLQR